MRRQRGNGAAAAAAAGSLGSRTSTHTARQDVVERGRGLEIGLGAAWVGKDRGKGTGHLLQDLQTVPPSPRLDDSTHPDAGEDAFFVTSCGSEDHGHKDQTFAFGVADGVGGWADEGVDASLFAWELVRRASDIAQRWPSGKEVDAKSLLHKSFRQLVRAGRVYAGSSTATFLTLTSHGHLTTANLGDSQFIVIRPGSPSIGYHSPSQTHFFNCPRQLTVLPMSSAQRDKIIKKDLEDEDESDMIALQKHAAAARHITDLPNDAEASSHILQEGDVVIVYTDGIGDNVWPGEMVGITRTIMREAGVEVWQEKGVKAHEVAENTSKLLASHIAHQVAVLAQTNGRKTDKISPFETEAKRHRYAWKGGKEDDISVVVSVVLARDRREPSAVKAKL